MSKRRLRLVAALTLAIVAAPFLAASAVAAQAKPNAEPAEVARTITWPARVGEIVDRLESMASIHELAEERALLAAAVLAPPPPPPPPPPPSPDDPATWVWPGNGPVTSPFGTRWGRLHEGVDIDAAYGSPVVAAHRGTVITAGWGQSGYGLVVEIDHGNGLVTRYAHLSAVTVSAGQQVERAAQIGAIGATGSVTAAHLHYEVRQHGIARNPMTWLPAGGASSAGNPG
jgi:murein DD-endopeptidase MepM/ murein hydrolase activator NlpD